MNHPLLSATQSFQSCQKHERGIQIAMSVIAVVRIRYFISLPACKTAQQEQNIVEKYWGGKNFFLWWPQVDQADLHSLWEVNRRRRAGIKVREGEGEQPQRCGCSSSCFTYCLQILRRLKEWFPLLPTAVTDGLSPWQGQPNPFARWTQNRTGIKGASPFPLCALVLYFS